jgi:hypothetical protein
MIHAVAQTGRSKTTRLSNGDRVTVSTGYNRSGYYRKVTVRRPDGTGESRTEQKNMGFLNTGLFDVSGGYGGNIPRWAGGQKEPGWGTALGVGVLIVLVVLLFGWPWMLHTTKPTKIVVACVWYATLLGAVLLITAEKSRSRRFPLPPSPNRDLAATSLVAPTVRVLRPGQVRPQVLGTESIWPQRFTDKWFMDVGRYLSPAAALQLGKELRTRGWSDEEIRERTEPHVPFRVI